MMRKKIRDGTVEGGKKESEGERGREKGMEKEKIGEMGNRSERKREFFRRKGGS